MDRLYPALLFSYKNYSDRKTVTTFKFIKINKSVKSGAGFTLIELLVVVSIMVILVSAMSINIAGQRIPRDLRIAQNQLVSNIRQAQSNTLSSRVLPGGQMPQFYLIKFDLSRPNEYKIQAVYNVSTSPVLIDVQTIQLPSNIQLAATNPIVIDRSPTSTAFYPSPPGSQYSQIPTSCGLISFAAPFAKVVFNGSCATTPTWDSNTDDYAKIINFQNNISCDVTGNPLPCSASTDSIMTITLTDRNNTMSKTVTVNAVTGGVNFN